MSLITRCQREVLTYWPPSDDGPNEFGEATYGPPQEITCRWDDKVQEIILSDQLRVVSNAEIISEIKLKVGGMIYRGPLPTTEIIPKENKDVHQIIRVAETWTIAYREALYEAWA